MTVRVGVIGAGIFGEHHAAVYSALDAVELVGVCDLQAERAKDMAARYGALAWYSSADELFGNADLDAISIATPDDTHTPLVLSALERGLHVLCEKPLATSGPEARRIANAVREAGVTLMVDFHNRVNPPFVKSKEAIESGEIGAVRHGYLRLSDTEYVPLEMLPWAGRSSALWFLGSHGVDLLRFLLNDEVVRVFGVKRRGKLVERGVDTDDFHIAILEFAHGAVVTIEHSWILPASSTSVYDFKLELVGDKGALYVDTSHNRCLELQSGGEMRYPDLLGVAPTGGGRIGGFVRESIARFVDAVLTGSRPVADADDGARATEIIEAIERSAISGAPVSLDQSGEPAGQETGMH
jgi:predicted dehydrogenase